MNYLPQIIYQMNLLILKIFIFEFRVFFCVVVEKQWNWLDRSENLIKIYLFVVVFLCFLITNYHTLTKKLNI